MAISAVEKQTGSRYYVKWFVELGRFNRFGGSRNPAGIAEGKVKVLIKLEDFSGWEPSDAWGDVSFFFKHDAISKRLRLSVIRAGVTTCSFSILGLTH
ncbi:MAG: STAS/SEC14 domain-containing protein [Gammaproteobacteria bacterium]|nr:STAS/SEC14 domain-containing protein [Gammaproteobacteria bacterium]